jgi:transcriptional regulator with XRE-family HTH domain
MEIFGKRIKELRQERNLGQKELARILSTSKQNLSRWEKGYFEPDQETTVRLARFFDVTTDYLFGLENEDGSKA